MLFVFLHIITMFINTNRHSQSRYAETCIEHNATIISNQLYSLTLLLRTQPTKDHGTDDNYLTVTGSIFIILDRSGFHEQ